MAASVYATPPPDLSGEDTALSDVSNSSQLSSSSSQSKATKRNANLLSNQTRTYDSTQLDQSKKRRKQTTPIRLSALNLSADLTTAITNTSASTSSKQDESENNEVGSQKLFLPNLEQSQITTETISNLQSQDNISSVAVLQNSPKLSSNNISQCQSTEKNKLEKEQIKTEDSEIMTIPNQSKKECAQCGEIFDSDLKLGVHILQQHATEKLRQLHKDENKKDGSELVQMKEDQVNTEMCQGEERISRGLSRSDDWLSMSGLGFPFPPEAAAAALTASNYLSQLPILSVPPVGAFPSVESLSRPPLRIFNPEAYCELCNKEFCNKYFLKTHKANKHGIYDPAVTSNDSSSSSQINSITQVLQMQFQQQQQQQQSQLSEQPNQSQSQQSSQLQLQQQQIQPIPTQNLQQQQQSQLQQQQTSLQSPIQSPLNPPESTVFCDICHKRFTNIFAMKRHRSKTHEILPSSSSHQIKIDTENVSVSGISDKEMFTPLRLPDGFREDFTIEQEDVSFTPQPRKLSPSSSQQAREANFSFEKLKRLGVINPEAFCDLCCKEYCNKYFLRTHKLKRHGILIPGDDFKDDKISWPFIQTTPLNLMMAAEKMQRKQIDNDELKKQNLQLKRDEEESSLTKYDVSEQDHINKTMNINKSTENLENLNLSVDMSTSSQDGEAISIDLQKLQSMILQLNDLSGQRPVCCHICGKDVENQYILHAHIATEHSSDNSSIGVKSQPASPSTSGQQTEICKQCDKEFLSLMDLKQHIMEVHGMSLDSPIREGFVTPDRPVIPGGPPTTPNQGDRRPPYTITPTSSYCEICNKELCNKYFMKTHMQRMHGIEIENGAQIGGVVCNICNKELCSKYFLRVHKHNTHGIVDEGSPLPQPRQNGDQQENEGIYPPIDNKSGDLADISSRYFTHYTEVCPLCSRRFRSSKWLRAHLMSDHGKAGTDKLREMEQNMQFSKPSSPTLKIPNGSLALGGFDPTVLAKNTFSNLFINDDAVNSSPRFKEYQCSMCSFSTPYYAFLFIHERSHTFLTQNPSLIKSETAVSIAKDQQRVTQPSTTIASSSSGTPTTTPASTPIPQTPQENANGNKFQDQKEDQSSEIQQQHQQEQQQQLEQQVIESQQQFQQHLILQQQHQQQQQFRDIPNSLGEIANLINRPASYAVPQNFSGEIMQSFLIEEVSALSAKCTNSISNTSNTNDGSAITGNETVNNNESSSNNFSRFIPAVVFLPVKERISGPITVSFTLTPA